MCFLYWIHLPQHIDPLTEGYIGVTNHLRRRKYLHKYNNENFYIKRHKDDIIMTTLCEATEEYCYELEANLRPQPYIGWNIVPGGGKPPSWKGKNHKMETIEKMRTAKLGKKRTPFTRVSPTEETKIKLAKAAKRKLTDQQILEIKNLLANGETNMSSLARRFNVSDAIIRKVKLDKYRIS